VHPSRNTRRPIVLGCVMLAMFMVAIEATIVATAMPEIVGQLGGFTLYSWVFSAFLLTQTTTIVIFGKLSDLYGRKPVLIGGIVVFLIGSVLCGFAWSMPSMIVFRLIQGLGAGSIQPVTMTIVGDLYTPAERAKIQGFLSSVWGFSAIVGPLAGGLIVDNLSWSWIFWINIPIGIVAALGFLMYLKEDIEHKARSIDYLGACLFGIAIASLLTALTQTQSSEPWQLALFGLVFLVSTALFLWHEGRAPEPMVALGLWTHRLIASANGATLLAGMALIGLTTFLPMYVQGVLGRSPVLAGFTLTMMAVGWPLASTVSARLFRWIGMHRTLHLGGVLMPVGAVFFLFLSPGSSPVLAGVGSFIMGFGMGLLSMTCIIRIQASVGWSERGSATASNVFARSLGNTLGATVLGAILNFAIAGLTGGPAGGARITSTEVHQVLDSPSGLTRAAGNSLIQPVLDQALHLTFWGVFIMAVATVLLTFLIPHPKHDAEPEALKR
jgi:EmrB/QacA subfamily drug resistance transporter